MAKPTPPLEKEEDAMCAQLWTLAGFTVISFSQAQKTQQTRGIADQMVLDNRSLMWMWFEVKRQKGPEWGYVRSEQSPHQQWFQMRVEQQGHRYEIGSRHRVAEILSEMGRVTL